MNRPEHEPRCEAALEILEPYLDGELSETEALRLRAHLERCPACAAELELAARIQRELRSLPQRGGGEVVPFPPQYRQYRQYRQHRQHRQYRQYRQHRRHRGTGLRVAAVAALLALAVGGGALFLRLQQQRGQTSQAEIARATAEARFALAYVGKMTRSAGLDLRDEVLEKRLIVPATRSVSRSLGGIPDPAAAIPPAGRPEKEF